MLSQSEMKTPASQSPHVLFELPEDQKEMVKVKKCLKEGTYQKLNELKEIITKDPKLMFEEIYLTFAGKAKLITPVEYAFAIYDSTLCKLFIDVVEQSKNPTLLAKFSKLQNKTIEHIDLTPLFTAYEVILEKLDPEYKQNNPWMEKLKEWKENQENLETKDVSWSSSGSDISDEDELGGKAEENVNKDYMAKFPNAFRDSSDESDEDDSEAVETEEMRTERIKLEEKRELEEKLRLEEFKIAFCKFGQEQAKYLTPTLLRLICDRQLLWSPTSTFIPGEKPYPVVNIDSQRDPEIENEMTFPVRVNYYANFKEIDEELNRKLLGNKYILIRTEHHIPDAWFPKSTKDLDDDQLVSDLYTDLETFRHAFEKQQKEVGALKQTTLALKQIPDLVSEERARTESTPSRPKTP